MIITTQTIIELMKTASEVIINNTEYLNQLDTVLGDGEHGSNMNKCFSHLLKSLPEWEKLSITELFKKIGTTFLTVGGGTATTLFGVAFLTASKESKDNCELNEQQIASIWTQAFQSLKVRSKAKLGDKTLIDSLEPATISFKNAVVQGLSMREALMKAALAADNGQKRTKAMIAKRGRGLYAGERGLGTPDPGATSVAIILKAWADNPF